MGTTSAKILNASILLFSQKGYDGVTTKEIAKYAGVSEMTIFRHFSNKRNLFDSAIEQFICSPEFKCIFENDLEGDLEKDLLTISLSYQEVLANNHKLILVQFRNGEFVPDMNDPLLKLPSELKKFLVEYFSRLKERGRVTDNPEILAINFLALNFGLFMIYRVNKKLSKNADMHDCICNFVKTFVQGVSS